MGKIILIKYSTKLPIFQGFRVIISLPELYFFANIRFKSHTLNTFSSCLQSKEILFVQQRFRYSFAAERKKPGFGVANRPLRSPDFYYSPCILPRKQEKNLSCLGRQKRFLLWRSGWDSNPRNLAVQLISSLLCNCDGGVRFGVISVSPVPAESRLKSGFFAQKALRDGLF